MLILEINSFISIICISHADQITLLYGLLCNYSCC